MKSITVSNCIVGNTDSVTSHQVITRRPERIERNITVDNTNSSYYFGRRRHKATTSMKMVKPPKLSVATIHVPTRTTTPEIIHYIPILLKAELLNSIGLDWNPRRHKYANNKRFILFDITSQFYKLE